MCDKTTINIWSKQRLYYIIIKTNKTRDSSNEKAVIVAQLTLKVFKQ